MVITRQGVSPQSLIQGALIMRIVGFWGFFQYKYIGTTKERLSVIIPTLLSAMRCCSEIRVGLRNELLQLVLGCLCRRAVLVHTAKHRSRETGWFMVGFCLGLGFRI